MSDVIVRSEEEPPASDLYIRMKMECAKIDCRVPVEFYIVELEMSACWNLKTDSFDDDEYEPIDHVDWVQKMHDGRFHGKCVKKHDLVKIPRHRYSFEIQQGLLPSMHDMIYWSRPNP